MISHLAPVRSGAGEIDIFEFGFAEVDAGEAPRLGFGLQAAKVAVPHHSLLHSCRTRQVHHGTVPAHSPGQSVPVSHSHIQMVLHCKAVLTVAVSHVTYVCRELITKLVVFAIRIVVAVVTFSLWV